MKCHEARNIRDLIKCFHSGSRPKYVFFWGHTPPKDNTVNQSCFSQWFTSPFVVNEVRYPTAEHYMMHQKAVLFGDEEVASQVLESKSPGAAKALGRAVKNFEQAVWDENAFRIVVEANFHKFDQNEAIGNYLVSTKQRVLVEASPKDAIWGIGLDVNAEGIENPENWRGKNLLGFALMEARQQLIEKSC